MAPYESLDLYRIFKVIPSSALANQSVNTGSFEPKYIPDHSLLCWEMGCVLHENKSNVNKYN